MAESEYSLDSSTQFQVPIALLRMLQIHPKDTTKKQSVVPLVLLSTFSLLFVIFALLKIIDEPSASLAENMLIMLPSLRISLAFFKVHVLAKGREGLNNLMKGPVLRISYPAHLQEQVDLYGASFRCKNWLFFGFVIFAIALNVVSLTFATFRSVDQSTMFKIWLPFELHLNAKIRAVLLAGMALALNVHICVVFGFSMMYVCLVSMGVKMLRHLNLVLKTLHLENLSEDWVEQDAKEVVRYAIQQHQRCIAFVDNVNSIFSAVLLLDVWTYLFGLCTISYHFFNFASLNLGVMAPLIQSIFIYTLYLGLSCWYADIFTDQGFAVATNCNSAAWWDWNPELAQDLNTMAIVAKVKLNFRAGPFYSLSMSSFLMILEIALTYVVILQQLN